jgi:tripartite-type tricarboxylate transporter receptor subunit TctC
MRTNALTCTRRAFFGLAGATGAVAMSMRFTLAQAYPSRPVRIVVGFAPGGATDVAARLISQSLSERFGRPFLVENRAGAGANLASEAVIRSAPDGHTLLAAGINDAVNATLFQKLTYNFIRDISPVAGIMTVPNLMVVHPSVPARVASLGGDALVSSPAEFGKLIADETEKWGRVVHSANIKAD